MLRPGNASVGRAGDGSVLAAVPIIDEIARRRFWLAVERSWRIEKRRRLALGAGDDEDEDSNDDMFEVGITDDDTGVLPRSNKDSAKETASSATGDSDGIVLTSEARATVEADRFSAAAVDRVRRKDRRRGRTPSTRMRGSGHRSEELSIRRAVQQSIGLVESWTRTRVLGLLAYRQLHATPRFYASDVDSQLVDAGEIMASLPEAGTVAARVDALLREKSREEAAKHERDDLRRA